MTTFRLVRDATHIALTSAAVDYHPPVAGTERQEGRSTEMKMNWALGLVALVLTAACTTQSEVFMHRTHRLNYALQPKELGQMQFYISTDVLANEIGNPQTEGTPAAVFVVERGTPGVVTEVGPTWLRVRFGDGEGAAFLANPGPGADVSYWLATEVPDSRGLQRIRDTDDRILRIAGRTFKLVNGSQARLMVKSQDLQDAIGQRSHAPGNTAE